MSYYGDMRCPNCGEKGRKDEHTNTGSCDYQTKR